MRAVVLLLLALGVNAEEIPRGHAVLIETPSPGFGGGLPHVTQINVYGPTLAFERTFAQYPSTAAPWTLTFSPAGDLYVSEQLNDGYGVVRYDGSGAELFARFSTLPRVLGFDAQGDLIIFGGGACDLAKFDPQGNPLMCVNVHPPLNSFIDFDLGADGCRMVVGQLQGIGIVDLCIAQAEVVTLPFATVDHYGGVRFLPDGTILATHGDASRGFRIDQLDGVGRLVRHLFDAVSFPRVALDPDGKSFWMVDSIRIRRISLQTGALLDGPSEMIHGITAPAIAIRGEWRAASSRARRRAIAH